MEMKRFVALDISISILSRSTEFLSDINFLRQLTNDIFNFELFFNLKSVSYPI